MSAAFGRLLRPALRRLLARLRIGTVVFRWSDGTEEAFGAGEPTSVIRFDDRAVYRTLRHGTEGFCDAYVEKDWDVVDGKLVDVMTAFVSARLQQPLKEHASLRTRLVQEVCAYRGRLSPAASVRLHYDLPESFYALWLDESLTYTCGLARDPGEDIATIQRRKLELVCERLNLAPGHSLLDLGCGWGSLAIHAAERGASVTAVNLSGPQLDCLDRRAAECGLSDRISRVHGDLGSASGTFDRIAAVGVAEHMGRDGIGRLFSVIADRLALDGVALVHTISDPIAGGTDPWIERRVFPGAYVPSLGELVEGARAADLRVCQVEDLGPHYAVTLERWLSRFLDSRTLVSRRFGDAFARTWEMYLAMLVPTFLHATTCVYQLVLTNGGVARSGLRMVTSGGYPCEMSLTPARAPVADPSGPLRRSAPGAATRGSRGLEL